MQKTQLITLTADEIISLIKEKTVQRDGICIACSDSFLAVLSLLEFQMAKELPHVKSKPA
jgi:hypothetical protein